MTNTLKEELTSKLNDISLSLDLVLNGLVYKDKKLVSLQIKKYIMGRKVSKSNSKSGYYINFTTKKSMNYPNTSIYGTTEQNCKNKAYDMYLKGTLDLSFFFYKELKNLIASIEKTTLFFDINLKGENENEKI